VLELESELRQEVNELFALGEQLEQSELPDGLDLADEIAFREGRLVNLAQAKRVLEARAQEYYAAEQAEYAAQLQLCTSPLPVTHVLARKVYCWQDSR